VIPLIKDFDTRDLLALGIVGAFIGATFLVGGDDLIPIKDMTLLVVGFYFGNKNSPSGSVEIIREQPAIVSMPCPYIAGAPAADPAHEQVEQLGEVL
jgi:hypothetical protein